MTKFVYTISMENILKVLMFSGASVVYLFIVSKISGKKQIAQLNYIDYVLAISIGSISAEMATDLGDTPFYLYLEAMSVFLLFDLLINFLERKGAFMKKFLKGKPLILIDDGKINYDDLKKSKLDAKDLLMLARGLGYFDIKDVAFAIFETNGNLTIMPKGAQKPTVAKDLNNNIEKASLPIYLIFDGNISLSSLKEIKKDKEWLFKKLGFSSKKELKQIILASYDEKNDNVIIHRK